MLFLLISATKLRLPSSPVNQTPNAVHDKLQLEEGNGIYIFKQRKMNPSDYESLRDLEFAIVKNLLLPKAMRK